DLPNIDEAAGTAVFTLTLSSASSTDVVVRVKTTDGTATSPADYDAVVETDYVIPAGSLSVNVPVAIHNDSVLEGRESFRLDIVSVSDNAVVGKPSAEADIYDVGNPDDPSDPTVDNDVPTVVSVSSAQVTEGEHLDFVVTLSNATQLVMPVYLALEGREATLGVDTGQVQVSRSEERRVGKE